MNYGFYIFGVRAYTINGPGNWRVIANETLPLPLVTTLTETGIHKINKSTHDMHVIIFPFSLVVTSYPTTTNAGQYNFYICTVHFFFSKWQQC